MTIPSKQTFELRPSVNGMSAWVDGKYLGRVDILKDEVIIHSSTSQIEPRVASRPIVQVDPNLPVMMMESDLYQPLHECGEVA